MKRLLGVMAVVMTALGTGACADVGDPTQGTQGGANTNDRSNGGDEGEKLLTGAMTISPNGNYVLAARSDLTILVDVQAQTSMELAMKADRWVFSKTRDVAYAMLQNRAGVVAIDLATGREQWKVMPAFIATEGATLAKVTNDDQTLVVGDYDRVFFIDTKDGNIRATAKVGQRPVDLEILPNDQKAVVVGATSWSTGKPLTPVSLVDLTTNASSSIEIPNCSSPIAVVPDGSRVMISPTFCTPESSGSDAPQGGWTSPDPVSMIDVDYQTGTLGFVKNLPGFGPVAQLGSGKAVAYLDMKRIDKTMFDDQSQIPPETGPQFHLMTIDPASMKFELSPIGNALPRFAASKDGHSLLVDASVTMTRSEATAKISFDGSSIKAEVGVFSDASGSLFGVFDTSTKVYTPFSGAKASLDRFVQTADGSKVFTLEGELLGDANLYGVDLAAKTSFDTGRDLRDIGILPDGRLVLRIRLEMEGRFPREEFCFSFDAQTCAGSVVWVSKVERKD
jgi:hypothetical protein